MIFYSYTPDFFLKKNFFFILSNMSSWKGVKVIQITDPAELETTKKPNLQNNYHFFPLKNGWKCLKAPPTDPDVLEEIRKMYSTDKLASNEIKPSLERHGSLWLESGCIHALVPVVTKDGKAEPDRMRAFAKGMLKRMPECTKAKKRLALSQKNVQKVDDYYMPMVPSLMLDDGDDSSGHVTASTERQPKRVSAPGAEPCTRDTLAEYISATTAHMKNLVKKNVFDVIENSANKQPGKCFVDFKNRTADLEKLVAAGCVSDHVSMLKPTTAAADFKSGALRAVSVCMAALISPDNVKHSECVQQATSAFDVLYGKYLKTPRPVKKDVIEQTPQVPKMSSSSDPPVNVPVVQKPSKPVESSPLPPPAQIEKKDVPPIVDPYKIDHSLFGGILSDTVDKKLEETPAGRLGEKNTVMAVAAGTLLQSTFTDKARTLRVSSAARDMLNGTGEYAPGSSLMEMCKKTTLADFLQRTASLDQVPSGIITKVAVPFGATVISALLRDGKRSEIQKKHDAVWESTLFCSGKQFEANRSAEKSQKRAESAEKELETERTSRKRCATELEDANKRLCTATNNIKLGEEQLNAANLRLEESEEQVKNATILLKTTKDLLDESVKRNVELEEEAAKQVPVIDIFSKPDEDW